MKMKKLLSGILAVATVFSMSVTAFAADETPAPSTEVAGITSYWSNVYNKFLTVGTEEMDDPVELEVKGMTSGYQPAAMSQAQAEKVSWKVTDSTVEGIKEGTEYTPTVANKGVNGYTSAVKVDVSDVVDDQYGYAIVQADYVGGEIASAKTVGFGIIFNPDTEEGIPTAKNVKCVFNVDGKSISATLSSVGISDIEGAAAYPNALYATKLAADAKNIKLDGVDTGYINSMTIDGNTYTNDYNAGGSVWTYTVKQNVAGSKELGAGILPIYNDYEIEWNYGPSGF